MWRRLFLTVFVLGAVSALMALAFVTWGYYYVTRDLPRLSRIEDYQPPAVSSVFSDNGTLIAEFFTEKRYPVKLKEVPDMVRKCFLAAEDASFYSHSGIDPVSIMRAVVKNLQSGNMSQGGSTITQQVVKNLLLTPEKNIIRKVKEAILSYRLERRFTKDEILEIYLNQIFFGNGAYGIKAAAKAYYQKDLADLTLGEASMLAGLPKAPSRYTPLTNMTRAKKRQKYVLQQMVDAGFITVDQMNAAFEEKLEVYPISQKNVFGAPYFVGEIRRAISEKWHDLDLDNAGLEITATVNLEADNQARKALRHGLRDIDKRRGWRGPIAHLDGGLDQYKEKYAPLIPGDLVVDEPYPAIITQVPPTGGVLRLTLGDRVVECDISKSTWAKKLLKQDDSSAFGNPKDVVRVGDVIEIALQPIESAPGKEGGFQFLLSQTPNLEGAIVLLDPNSGEVKAMDGGYEYGASQFNRVTQSLRQPGSAFKPVVYLSAIDKFHYTPSTIVHDEPRTFRVGDTFWTPGNFDEKFLGPITLRVALEKSRNLVSADIVSRIGVDAPIEYARKLGITSPLGRNLSLSLGSSEVTLLEMSRAYGVLAAKGMLFDSVFITKIKDRFGEVIYDYEKDKVAHAKKVLDENSAFIMTNMMRGVVESGTAYKVKALGRPVAGKTGTSNEQMDAWFIGFTPNWVSGVWVGFDQKKQIGPKETGGVVSAPIWLDFMKEFLATSEGEERKKLEAEAKEEADRLGIAFTPPEFVAQTEFPVPEGVDPYWVIKSSGLLASQDTPGAILEYFKKGTEPPRVPEHTEEGAESDAQSYLESPDL